MHRAKPLASCFLLCMVVSVICVLDADATVTIKGKVEYWDRIDKKYRPARDVRVEVEGDWWDSDPKVQTNQNGTYYATQGDPFWSWDDYDISIDAYARTPDLIEVYEYMFAWWPYHATSQTVKGVKGGQTCTIDMKVGGPQNNAASAWSRTIDETANAFIVHQEMYDHYEFLRARGFLSTKFEEYEVIVPAAGVAPYFNHATGYINLVLADLAGKTGTGNWTNIPSGSKSYVAYPAFKVTCRHEYSHAIHDHLTGVLTPAGLYMPAEHSVYEETNRYLAFTEGWAEFLPCATVKMGGNLEPARTIAGGASGLGIAPADPPGGHYAWEGEVAALLWDIHDPAGQQEVLRHPAQSDKTANHKVPTTIVDAQQWTDRIADPNLSRTRKVVEKLVWWGPVPTPVETIKDFLTTWQKLYPQDLHALKAAAFNRDIVVAMPKENQPVISAAPKLKRNFGTLNLQCTIHEPDPEDRPFIAISVWHQAGNAQPNHIVTQKLASGWQGDKRATKLNLNVPAPSGPADFVWIIVSDEMLPSAYRLGNPAQEAIMIAKPILDWWKIRPPVRVIEGAEFQPVQPKSLKITDPSGLSPSGDGTKEATRVAMESVQERSRRQKEADLRKALEEARDELERYGEAQELLAKADTKLYRVARTTQAIAGPAEPPELLRRPPALRVSPRTTAPATHPQALGAYNQWLDRAAAGQVQQVSVPPAAQQAISAFAGRLQAEAQHRQQMNQRVENLIQRIHNAAAGVDMEKATPMARDNTRRTVDAMAQALRQTRQAPAIAPDLQKRSNAIQRLTGQGAAAATQITIEPIQTGRSPSGQAPSAAYSEDFQDGQAQGWQLDPGWQVAQYARGQWALRGTRHTWASYTGGSYSDFTLKLRLRIVRGTIHINCRTRGPQRYFIGLNNEAVYLMKQTGPEAFSGELAHGAIGLTANQWHQVAVTARGSQLSVTVDGTPALSYTDPAPLTQGGIAFETLENTEAWIDNVTVSGAAQGAVGMQPITEEARALEMQPIAGRARAVEAERAAAAQAENFERQPLTGWELGENARVQQVDRGHALVFSGPSHAFWGVPPAANFSLRFRYRAGDGELDVALSASGEPPQNQEYHLVLMPEETVLFRQSPGQEQVLAAAPSGSTPTQWHTIAIQVSNGQITVMRDGQTILQGRDQQPLPPGAIVFLCHHGGGFAIDDLAFSRTGGQ